MENQDVPAAVEETHEPAEEEAPAETSDEVEEIAENEIPQSAATEEVPEENTNTTPAEEAEEVVEVNDNDTPLAQTGDNLDVLLIALGAAIVSIGALIFKRR